MEDQMCWEIDYRFLAEQKKARAEQEQREGVIKTLLNEANKQADDTRIEAPAISEAAPAK
jgi:hypothetical protein